MLEIRIHGRGGQGVVTAAELLSIAAFREGQYAQAFPSFGSERMGAPVTSFCRIDARPIRVREPIDRPDVVVVQEPRDPVGEPELGEPAARVDEQESITAEPGEHVM
jgi:pyruvate ferredoxin oxidoreductase gamma subunit